MAQFSGSAGYPLCSVPTENIIDPAKELREPLTSKQLIDERYLFAPFAIEIIDNPIADRTFRANLSCIALYIVMLDDLQCSISS